MFTSARWRLTLWFVAVLGIILAILGVAVYFTARKALLDGLDDDLRARAAREVRPLAARLLESGRRGEALPDVRVGPVFTAGGYFYALADSEGQLLVVTQNVDPSGLASPDDVVRAIDNGPSFASTKSSSGEDLRVYVVPLEGARGTRFVLEVGRSMEPELKALRRLTLILVGGGGVGLALASVGGFFLAGKALSPIRRAMDRQRTFVADASHELRTPLSLIRASAELLRRHPKKTVQANIASVDDIIAESDRLGTLVSQLLTLALADADKAPFTFVPVDLHQLVQEVARQVEPLAESKDLTLTVLSDQPLWVRGDLVRLRELLLILVDNAIKFTEPGGAVRLELSEAGGRVRLTVSDTGRGIPAEALPHIFERFYRADEARRREEGSAGLGLAIAKWIVENHRGSIRVESQPSKGTTFEVALPVFASAKI